MREDVAAWAPAGKRSTVRTVSPSDARKRAPAIPAGPAPAMMTSYCWCFGTVWKPRASATRRTVGFSSDVPSTETVIPVFGSVALGCQSDGMRLAERKARIALQLLSYLDPEM